MALQFPKNHKATVNNIVSMTFLESRVVFQSSFYRFENSEMYLPQIMKVIKKKRTKIKDL